MQEARQGKSIDSLLDELEQTLVDERRALICVDAETIEATSLRKSALNEALLQRKSEIGNTHKNRLSAMHQDVRHNLILLVHAREYVQNTIGLLTGQTPTVRPYAKPFAEAVRLDLRG